MQTALRRVARGLRLVVRGLNLMHAALATLLLLTCLTSWVPVPETIRMVTILVISSGLAAAGVVVLLVGRCLCLAVPPEATAARARIVITLLLEGCGLASGAAWLADHFGGWLPDLAAGIGGGFALLTSLAARVMFLFFARSVARFINAPPRADGTKSLLFVTAALAAGLLFGGCVLAVLTRLKAVYGLNEMVMVLAVGGYAIFVLYSVVTWFTRYTRTLNELSTRVDLYADTHAEEPADDDPDREYRERYERGD